MWFCKVKFLALLVVKVVLLESIIILCLGANIDVAQKENSTLKRKGLTEEISNNERQNGNIFPPPEEHSHESMSSMIASLISDSDQKLDSMNNDLYETKINERIDGTLKEVDDESHEWQITLDQADSKGISLEWSVNYVANEVSFQINIDKLRSNFRQGADVFGLGFSQDGELQSSDFCLIWHDLSHRLHLQDAWTDSEGKLRLIDVAQSNCRLLGHNNNELELRRQDQQIDWVQSTKNNYENQNTIRIKFMRPLEVCDDFKWDNTPNYYKIDNGTTHLVWFTLGGPLLELDGLDLVRFLREKSKKVEQQSIIGDGEEVHYSKRFQSGLKRIQLIRNKVEKKSHVKENENINLKSRRKTNFHMDIVMDKFEVPARETTYWCKLFKLNKRIETKKYHITKYEPVILPKANERVVHHMELFSCANLNTKQEQQLHDLYTNKGGWSGECNGLSRPIETKPCKKVILAWAMGANTFEYPEEVGQAIGGRGYSPFVLLEVHYNNVHSTGGIIDNSGLRFHYTSRLRPFDAGILEVGLEYSDKVSIPPGMLTPIAGYCVSECTRVALSEATGTMTTMRADKGREASLQHGRSNKNIRNKENSREEEENFDDLDRNNNNNNNDNNLNDNESSSSNNVEEGQFLDLEGGQNKVASSSSDGSGGIYIFAGQMHTHLAGVASWTEHIREGRFLSELQRDNHYSPHFQEIRLLSKPVRVEPGDTLIHYCLYDTRKRPNITLGGFATSDEMCVTYLHYYPRIDLEVCKSSVDSSALEQYFAYLSTDEAQNTSRQLLELATQSMKVDHSDDHHPVEEDEHEREPSERMRPKEGFKDYNNEKKKRSTTMKEAAVARKSVSENYRSIEWSPRRSRELIEFYSNAPLSIQCNRSNGDRWPGHWNGIRVNNNLLLDNLVTQQQSDSHKLESSFSLIDSRPPPFNLRQPLWPELINYRGREFKRRHEKCVHHQHAQLLS